MTNARRRKEPTAAQRAANRLRYERLFCAWLGPLAGRYKRHEREWDELHDLLDACFSYETPRGARRAAAKRVGAIIEFVVVEKDRWRHAEQHFDHGHDAKDFVACLQHEEEEEEP